MRNPFIVPLTALVCLLAACSAGSEGEGDAPAQAMEASASIIGGGEIEWGEGDQVSYAADTTPAPKAAKFAQPTTVWQRKSDYYNITLAYEGDFRPVAQIFAADFAKQRARLDGQFVTYGGDKGQADNWGTTVSLNALTPRLAVLMVADSSYTSGASHGWSDRDLVVWDRSKATELAPGALFVPAKPVPEADNFVCEQALKAQTGALRRHLCKDPFFGDKPQLAGLRTKNGKITGAIVVADSVYAYDLCVSVPYRLFAAKVAEGWRDQFADDPGFEGKIEENCR